MIEPLRVSLDLECSAEHAFRTWTDSFGTWWPRDHTASGDDDVDVVFQARLGGRIFERATDGTETEWGEVTRWEPPNGFGYRWHLRRDRADATDVDVAFVDVGSGRCRLDIVHSGWERLGADARAWRDANQGGWDGLLPHFAAATRADGSPEIEEE
jgi:Activator of Hsp90 ATPase homolog 1-like protein